MSDLQKRMQSIFYADFTTNAGLMALFAVLRMSPEPMKVLEECFDFWAKKKKEYIQEVVKLSIDVNNHPENYSLDELYTYGSINPEDYTIASDRAIAELKKEIIKEFEKFIKG